MAEQIDGMSASLVLDGVENATDSLQKAAVFAVSDDAMKWKWLPLTIDHALYTAAISCLAHNLCFVMKDSFGGWIVSPAKLLKEKAQSVVFNGGELHGPQRIMWENGNDSTSQSKKRDDKPLLERDLIGFWKALARVQDGRFFMSHYCITNPLVLTDEDMYWLLILHNKLSNPLMHYKPVMFEIPVSKAAKACRVGAWAAAFLLADSLSDQVLHLDQKQRESIAKSYRTIKETTELCEQEN
ncbi:MAG: hypothetical protein KKF10_05400 [Verrucomicrobia bacterium]|nr:hypothetical protein [Verrucomicrobiota bacterium]